MENIPIYYFHFNLLMIYEPCVVFPNVVNLCCYQTIREGENYYPRLSHYAVV